MVDSDKHSWLTAGMMSSLRWLPAIVIRAPSSFQSAEATRAGIDCQSAEMQVPNFSLGSYVH